MGIPTCLAISSLIWDLSCQQDFILVPWAIISFPPFHFFLYYPVFFINLTSSGYGQCVLGNIIGYGRACCYIKFFLPNGCNQIIASHKGIVFYNDSMLLLTIIVTKHNSTAYIDILPYLSVSYIC